MKIYKCNEMPNRNNIYRNPCCLPEWTRPCPPPLPPHHGDDCQKQRVGDVDQNQEQGDLSAAQGPQSQSQGSQSETQGDLSAAQGPQSQSQGSQSETQGDLSAVQGAQSQSQGEQSETLGDMTQTQGSETQGDQTQSMTGHGGQSQGEQMLSSSPSISTPVTVSGVTVNVAVSCGEGCQKHREEQDCMLQCRKALTALLTLAKSFSLVITNAADALIRFYALGLEPSPTIGNLAGVAGCTFTLAPQAGGKNITVQTDTLEALVFAPTENTPSLFSLLLAYLAALPGENTAECCGKEEACCYCEIAAALQQEYLTQAKLQINLPDTSFTGYIYKISDGIIYLVDSLAAPTAIEAIPICKIVSYQPQ